MFISEMRARVQLIDILFMKYKNERLLVYEFCVLKSLNTSVRVDDALIR
jgi:hypothetical protein